MRIALASPRVASSVEEGLEKIRRSLAQAADFGARIVCYPEAYLPGLRGLDFDVPPFNQAQQELVLRAASEWTRTYKIAAVLGMEWHTSAGRHIAAVVLDNRGELRGVQTKNQLDPSEDPLYVPGTTRQLFEIDGLRFGVAICHEAFRYPETVRWAAARGAKLVFHPHCTGSDKSGPQLTEWGVPSSPYYEKAMMCRGLENTIYFASVNYAFRYQESATTLIGPSGECVAHLPYGEEGILVQDIDPTLATGLLASRYAPERYREGQPQSFDLQPHLKGDLLELRPLRADDFDALFAVASDPLIWEQHPSSNRYQEDVFRQFFREAMESGGALLALDNRDGRVIGTSRFKVHDGTPTEIEIGWTFLARSHWGGTYNQEMKQLMLRHAFQYVNSVIFVIGPRNFRSRRAVEKIGGVLADDTRLAPDGSERVVYRLEAAALARV